MRRVTALVLTSCFGYFVTGGAFAVHGVAHADGKRQLPRSPADHVTGKQRIVGILDIKGPSPEVEAAFETSLEQQLDSNTYWLATRSQMRERLRNSTKFTDGCLVGQCLAEVKVQTQAQLVLLAALTGSGTSFGFVVTLVRTDTGKVLSQATERCDVCTQSEAMTKATLATIELLNNAPDKLPDEAGDQGAAIDLAVAPWQARLGKERRSRKRTGIALAVVGLVTAGAGVAAYLLQDGRPVYGLAAATAGGGLVFGGVLVLTF